MKIIQHPDIPKPAGHYSPVIEHQGVLYVSGQLPRHPDGSMPEDIEAQTRLAMDKIRSLLRAANSDLDHLLQVRIYIPDVSLWGDVNTVYADIMGGHRPARCVVPSRELHHGCLIEIEAVAAVRPA
ncbi:RidA family protein [Lewinella sp. W8]|uniref:RidA family protein n=1 Tax=Lewinella sp. W8 TaxID=2528208 RepID=UPI001068569C|nr:RidA family protein [Lewinella sp. W8]MTB53289.1 RidA family protein [Lewinella sp. W8]